MLKVNEIFNSFQGEGVYAGTDKKKGFKAVYGYCGNRECGKIPGSFTDRCDSIFYDQRASGSIYYRICDLSSLSCH